MGHVSIPVTLYRAAVTTINLLLHSYFIQLQRFDMCESVFSQHLSLMKPFKALLNFFTYKI